VGAAVVRSLGSIAIVLAFVLAFALAPACGSSAAAPLIASLRLSAAAPIHAGDVITLTVDFVDEDGDLSGGIAEVSIRRIPDQPEGDLFKVPLSGGSASTHGTVTTTVQLPATTPVGHYDISITLIDRSLRRSNPLVTSFDLTAS
jgi:hypothetical protein